MIKDDTQPSLFRKVIDLEEARKARDGQQKLFEAKERLIPYSEVEQLNSHINKMFAQTQEELRSSNKKVDRLANTLERVIPALKSIIIDDEAPMLRLANLEQGHVPDVAFVDGAGLPAELVYTLFAKDIAQTIGKENTTPTRIGMMLGDLRLKGNPDFHREFHSSQIARTQKYTPTIIREIYRRLAHPEKYDISSHLAMKHKGYLKAESEVIQ